MKLRSGSVEIGDQRFVEDPRGIPVTWGAGEVGIEHRGGRPIQQVQLSPTPSPGRGEGLRRGTRVLRRSRRVGRPHLRDEGPGEPQSQYGANEVVAARLPVGNPPYPRAQLLCLQPHGSPPVDPYDHAPFKLSPRLCSHHYTVYRPFSRDSTNSDTHEVSDMLVQFECSRADSLGQR
jgi:hypothetical protein